MRVVERLRGPLSIFFAAALPAGAIFAALSVTKATGHREYPLEPAPPSPWVVQRSDGTLPGGCQIAVVVDDDGARSDVPLRLARVSDEGTAEEWRAITSRNGAHRFLDLPAGVYQLTAVTDDRAVAAAPEWTCSGRGERAFFTLPLAEAEHVLHATFVSAGRKAGSAAGAEIALAQESDSRSGLAGVARIPANPDGTLTVRLAPGRYVAMIQAPGHAPMVRKLAFTGDDKEHRAKFALTPAPRVRGQVLDEDGAPIVDALVALGGGFDPKAKVARVRTDAEGRFSLPVASGQDVNITARGAGRVARASLGVVEGTWGRDGVILVAQQGRNVQGVVTKTDGTPLAFGEVRYRVRDLGLTGVERADADGRFVLDGMPLDADVEVWAEGNATGAWGAVVATPGSDMLALTYIAPPY